MSTAVKEAAARADALIAELAKGAAGPVAEPEPETAAGAAIEPEPETAAGAATEPEPETAVGVQAHEPSPTHAIEQERDLWAQRYRTLQGMFDSQARQIEQLQSLLANMQSPPTPAAAPVQVPASLVGAADEEAFGKDLIDLQRRVAREEQTAAAKALEARLAAMEANLTGVARATAETAQERFVGVLQAQVQASTGRTFDEINYDPAFKAWIEASPARHRVFSEAVNSADVPGTLEFFEMFSSKNPPAQVSGPTPAAAPQSDPRLERQVAPGRSKSVPSPSQRQNGSAQTWTRSGIAEFYAKRKTYEPAERDRVEREIAAAQREGRVNYTQ